MQKVSRKYVRLSEFQMKRLEELSEFDGLDLLEHVRRAMDTYLQAQKPMVNIPVADEIVAEIKDFSDDPKISRAMWVSGIVDRYEFSVLVLHEPSKTGLDKGRISKLSIWDPLIRINTNNFIDSCIVNYDRGWDVRPSKIAEPYYGKVKKLIDNYTAHKEN